MTREEYRREVEQIDRESLERKQALAKRFLGEQLYPNGCRVRRLRMNPDGTVYDEIIGVVIAADMRLDYPDYHYWVRVVWPTDYRSRQRCKQHGIEMGYAEDFWQADERWAIVNEQD